MIYIYIFISYSPNMFNAKNHPAPWATNRSPGLHLRRGRTGCKSLSSGEKTWNEMEEFSASHAEPCSVLMWVWINTY